MKRLVGNNLARYMSSQFQRSCIEIEVLLFCCVRGKSASKFAAEEQMHVHAWLR